MSKYLDEDGQMKHRCDFCGLEDLTDEDINETEDGELCDECYVRHLEGDI